MSDEAATLLVRLEAVAGRLRRHAESAAPGGLTAPDPPTGERWDWGQVWAHLAEFLPYWMGQVRMALAASPEEQVPFGRTKADPERIAAIERDRHVPVRELIDRLEGQMDDLRALVGSLSAEDWSRSVSHSTLGLMDMERVFDEFLVGHLEQHAAQLDELTGEASA
jgi:DinB superfamily